MGKITAESSALVEASRLRRAIDYDFSDDEIISLLTQMLSRSPERPMLDLVFARQLYLVNKSECVKFVTDVLLKKHAGLAFSDFHKQIASLCPGILLPAVS